MFVRAVLFFWIEDLDRVVEFNHLMKECSLYLSVRNFHFSFIVMWKLESPVVFSAVHILFRPFGSCSAVNKSHAF